MNKIQENKLREMIRNMIEAELSEDLFPKESDSPYQKLFRQTLSKYGVSSPDELSPKLKEKFFSDIDASWDAGENETDLDETSNSSSAGEYMTPNAFTKDKQDYENSPASNAMKDWKKTKRIDEIKSGDTVTIDKDGKLLTINKLKNVKNINDLQKFGLDVLQSVDNTEKISSGEKVTFLASPTMLHALVRTQKDKVGIVTRDMISEQIDFKDENFSPKQKMAQAIRSVRESLMGVEKLVDQSKIFKEQNNIKSNDMYKRSHAALRKINEQMIRIMNKMQGIK